MKNKTTIEDIINHIYEDSFYKGFSSSFHMSPYIGEEIFQEFILIILEQPIEKMIKLYDNKEFIYYSKVIIQNLVFNKYSTINKNYKQQISLDEYELDIEDKESNSLDSREVDGLLKRIDTFLEDYSEKNKDFWYDKELFNMYFYEDETYRSIGKKTRIPFTSIFHSIAGTKKLIQDKFGKDYLDVNNNE